MAKSGSHASTPEITDGRRARRARTEAKLLQAVGDILREEGVAALGVNAIAARAGVDKVLAYRYYGGVEGLMAAYATSAEFWPTSIEILGPDHHLARDPDRPRAAARILANYAEALRRRPVTLDLLAWECSQRNSLTVAMEEVREQRSQELFQILKAAGFPLVGGVAELSALLVAAIHYLVVRGREVKVFAGLPIGAAADWQNVERLVEATFRAVMGTTTVATSTATSMAPETAERRHTEPHTDASTPRRRATQARKHAGGSATKPSKADVQGR